jgi:hypothetical protein
MVLIFSISHGFVAHSPHRTGSSLGLGYVHNEQGVSKTWLTGSSFTVEIAGDRAPAKLLLGPLYDPKNQRIKYEINFKRRDFSFEKCMCVCKAGLWLVNIN